MILQHFATHDHKLLAGAVKKFYDFGRQGVSEVVPFKVSNNVATTSTTPLPTSYSYGTYRASQFPQQDKLLNYHPLYHSPIISNNKVTVGNTVDRFSDYYHGSRLADMSQGSCDNTPATPVSAGVMEIVAPLVFRVFRNFSAVNLTRPGELFGSRPVRTAS